MSDHLKMTSAPRSSRPNNYKNVFKGSVLVNTLMDYDPLRFPDRTEALKFGQKLVDMDQLETVVGTKVFEDSAMMYRWTDETIVKEAKKIMAAQSIPKRRLIGAEFPTKSDSTFEVDIVRSLKTHFSAPLVPPASISLPLSSAHTPQRINNSPRQRAKPSGPLPASKVSPNLSVTPVMHQAERRSGSSIDYGAVEITFKNKEMHPEKSRDSNGTPVRYHNGIDALGNLRTSVYADDVFDDEEIKSKAHGTKVEERRNTVCYDGVEMPSIDLDHPNFPKHSDNYQYTSNGDHSGYSDNEKQLYLQLQYVREEHEKSVEQYENKLKELSEQIKQMQALVAGAAKNSEIHNGGRQFSSTRDLVGSQESISSSHTGNETLSSNSDSNVQTPPPPPPPPPPPLDGSGRQKVQHAAVQPSKPVVRPRVKMRPLFWKRLILERGTQGKECVWKDTRELPSKVFQDLERCFGRESGSEKELTRLVQNTTLRRQPSSSGRWDTIKALDTDRSKNIAIKLKSLHCTVRDVEDALIRLDFRKMDIDRLQTLVGIKATDEELDKMRKIKEEDPYAMLDELEDFLFKMASIPQFDKRIECLSFQKTLHESLFNIDQQLDMVQIAVRNLKVSSYLHTVLHGVLSLGNYMNGGTTRGQADGFDIEVITKLKDVKSMDNSTNLLAYIVHVQTEFYEPDAGRSDATLNLPDVAIFTQAQTVSFKDIHAHLKKLRHQLQLHLRKNDVVCLDATASTLHPFKENMEDFFESAEAKLCEQEEKLTSSEQAFQDVLDFFAVENRQSMSSEIFFGMWATFLDSYKIQWKIEQMEVAKRMFAKVDQNRKDRIQQRRRRGSTTESGKPNLKQKFEMMRSRNDNKLSETVRLLRSNSISAIDTALSFETSKRHTEKVTTKETRKTNNTDAIISSHKPVMLSTSRPANISRNANNVHKNDYVGSAELGTNVISHAKYSLSHTETPQSNGQSKTRTRPLLSRSKSNASEVYKNIKKYNPAFGESKTPTERTGKSMIERLKENRRQRTPSDTDEYGDQELERSLSSPSENTGSPSPSPTSTPTTTWAASDRLTTWQARASVTARGGKATSPVSISYRNASVENLSAATITATKTTPLSTATTTPDSAGQKVSMKERMERRKRDFESKGKLVSVKDLVTTNRTNGMARSQTFRDVGQGANDSSRITLRKQASLTSINTTSPTTKQHGQVKSLSRNVSPASDSSRTSLTSPNKRQSSSTEHLSGSDKVASTTHRRMSLNAAGSACNIVREVRETRTSKLRQAEGIKAAASRLANVTNIK